MEHSTTTISTPRTIISSSLRNENDHSSITSPTSLDVITTTTTRTITARTPEVVAPDDVVVDDESLLSTEQRRCEESLSERSLRRRKMVQFSTVEINEHPIILGCNPAVSCGVPISIDWDRISHRIMSLHDYESIRTMKAQHLSQHQEQCMFDATDRYYMLQSLGYSYKELRDAEKAVNTIRKYRQQSMKDIDDDACTDENRDDTNTKDHQRRLSRSITFFPPFRRLRQRSIFRSSEQRSVTAG